MAKYSVLLLYPDYIADGVETYYEWTEVESVEEGIRNVQRMAVAANPDYDVKDLDDFMALFVAKGHIEAEFHPNG